jgi:hypothetical protein
VTEDLFAGKVAFVALLNFPLTTLEERLKEGPQWSRRAWAEARLTQRFSRRVPARVQQEIAKAMAAADLYIAEYNLWMHHVLTAKGERLFPSGKRLISHWNLRDELKANYADPRGLDKQRLIIQVMERIVTQTIPAAVIDNPARLILLNKVTRGQEVEADARTAHQPRDEREADTRSKVRALPRAREMPFSRTHRRASSGLRARDA